MQKICAEISLKTIAHNAMLIQRRAGVPLIAVVKDDAYGHGAEAVAHALEETAAMFAVSTVEEGEALRIAGISKEILLFTPLLSEEEVLRAAAYSLTPTLSSAAGFGLFVRTAEKYALPRRVQLAFNTGMNRYGFRPGRTAAVMRRAKACGLKVEGVYSHLYLPEDEAAREEQYRLFCEVRGAARRFYPEANFHLSATGGILAGRKYAFDMVRSGIALYGYLPSGFENALKVKPAMKVFATVSRRGSFTGGGIGYGKADSRFGTLNTLAVGYGAGFFREGGLGVGKLCMDACVREGDIPFGRRVCILSDAAEYAAQHGTTAYEALVRIGSAAEKKYI